MTATSVKELRRYGDTGSSCNKAKQKDPQATCLKCPFPECYKVKWAQAREL